MREIKSLSCSQIRLDSRPYRHYCCVRQQTHYDSTFLASFFNAEQSLARNPAVCYCFIICFSRTLTNDNIETVITHHAMKADGTTYITVDVTVTYANAISGGNIEFRFVCAANWQANGKGALTKPNGGTIRWGGAGTADSPRIQIVP